MGWILFNSTGLLFILRWLHFFFGVIWIGHLYYFNFVHGSFMAEADAAAKPSVVTKLLPRALWWFRWGAMGTMVTGVLYLGHRISQFPSFHDFILTSYGITISIGAVLGLTMWANVWFVIWPNQKVVIQSATQTAQGGSALPTAAAAAARATIASRMNTLFSIPMLFFMGAASHLPLVIQERANFTMMWGLIGALWLGFEGWALKGKTGILQPHKNAIIGGFALMAVFYVILELSLG
jgi:uncharacterized membrane protein